jgi:hypothetical protein
MIAKRTLNEWAKIKGIKILDADGFDRNDPDLFNKLFTEQEFDKGVLSSSVIFSTVIGNKLWGGDESESE